MTKNEVIRAANKFCAQYDIHDYPVKIVDICEANGIKVFEEFLPANVSGFIISRNNDSEEHSSDKLFDKYNSDHVIVVNRFDSASRRRFTIAHELAHFVLHRRNAEDLYAHRDAGQSGGIESEANIFASNILMPEELVDEALSLLEDSYPGYISLTDKAIHISNEFAVSVEAARVRLDQLRIS